LSTNISHKIYSIFDSKAEAYLQPFFATTDGVAMRMFEQAIVNNAQFAQYAEDYSLWTVGHWDETDGTLAPTRITVLDYGHVAQQRVNHTPTPPGLAEAQPALAKEA